MFKSITKVFISISLLSISWVQNVEGSVEHYSACAVGSSTSRVCAFNVSALACVTGVGAKACAYGTNETGNSAFAEATKTGSVLFCNAIAIAESRGENAVSKATATATASDSGTANSTAKSSSLLGGNTIEAIATSTGSGVSGKATSNATANDAETLWDLTKTTTVSAPGTQIAEAEAKKSATATCTAT